MIVLRLTSGETSHEVRTPRAEAVLGSDPTADITLQNVGLASRAVRLRRFESEVEVEVLGTDRRLRLRVGDEIEVGQVRLALVGLRPAETETSPIFGGYGDDGIGVPARRFELAEAGPPPVAFGVPSSPAPAASETSLPRADAPAPTRSSTPPPDVEAPAAPRPEEPEAAAKRKAQAELKPVMFPDPDFGAELLAQLKRSPFFALSLAFHLLVFFILSLFDSTEDPSRLKTGLGAMSASLDADAEEQSLERLLEEDEGLQLREPELPDVTEPLYEEKPKPPPPPDAKPPSPFRDEPEAEELEPLEIGIMPGLRVASHRLSIEKPKVEKADLKRDFQRGMAGSSNQRSAEIVRAELGRGRGGHASLKDLMPEDVLVIDGSFDHIEKVLDALHIGYVKKSPWALSAPVAENFKTYKVVFWNCGEALTKQRITAIAKHLKAFVRNGGYLFTTDWGVATVLNVAFPGYLKSSGNRAHLPEMTLLIEPAASAANHPLLDGVFRKNVQGKWWLEKASFDVSVGRKDKVTVLIESPELRDTFNRSPVVAATFHYGRGRVLHTMGHYYQEAGNLAGTISAHRLALNFVLMRLDQERAAGRR